MAKTDFSFAQTPYQVYGIQCRSGWAKLYEPLIRLCEHLGIEVAQVKEKFGTLRFYTVKHDERVQSLIDAAENYSAHVCEKCGTGGVESSNFNKETRRFEITYKANTGGYGWIQTLCKPCREIYEAESATVRP